MAARTREMAAAACAALRSHKRRLDLRFADRDAEATFKADIEPVLATYTGIMGFVLFIFTLAFVWIGARSGDEPFQWGDTGPKMYRLYGTVANAILYALCTTLCFLRVRCGFLRALDWEVVVIIMIVLCTQQSIVCRPSMYSMICEQAFGSCAEVDMTDGYHLGMELLAPLAVDMAITATHLSLPIRSCRSWVLDVVLLAEFILLTFWASKSGHYILLPGSCIQFFGVMTMLAGAAYMGARRNERHVRSQWKAQGKVVEQRHQLGRCRGAMATILSRLCDSLVHLGADLTIVQECPSLGALLFRRQTLGSNFCDLMALESERPAFVDALRNTSPASSVTEADARMIHVSLLDSFKKTVRVHVHHACFWADDGEVQYILGLVETGERQIPPSETARAQPQPVALPELSKKQEVALARDDSGGFTVASVCAELRSLLGDGLEGGAVDALLHGKDLEGFLQWLRQGLHAAQVGAGSVSADYGTVTLLTLGDNSALMYQARISGIFDADGRQAVLRVKPPRHAASGSQSSGRGTPADARRRRLEGSQASAASSPPSVASGGSGGSLPAPGFTVSKRLRVTKDHGRQRSALILVGSWNIRMPRKICCAFHANVSAIMRQFTTLRELSCGEMRDLLPLARDSWQCRHCGILGDGPDENGVCSTCMTEDASTGKL